MVEKRTEGDMEAKGQIEKEFWGLERKSLHCLGQNPMPTGRVLEVTN